jgi:hypothetical protein
MMYLNFPVNIMWEILNSLYYDFNVNPLNNSRLEIGSSGEMCIIHSI